MERLHHKSGLISVIESYRLTRGGGAIRTATDSCRCQINVFVQILNAIVKLHSFMLINIAEGNYRDNKDIPG